MKLYDEKQRTSYKKMSTNNPIRQHFIPKFLLGHFLDDNGRLWVHDKNQNKTYSTNPKNAFVKNDAYTTYQIKQSANHGNGLSTEKDYKHESAFAEDIESKAAPVILHIINTARSLRPPQLSLEQINDLKRFMLSVSRRTPESQKRVQSTSDPDPFYTAANRLADKDNYLLPDRETLYRNPNVQTLREYVLHNVDAEFAAGNSPQDQNVEGRFCRETGIGIAVIRNPSPRNSFLIGSHGLAIVQACHPDDSVKGSWLPIAHDVAVLATAFPDKDYFLGLDGKGERIIETINAASDAYSKIIAGRSEDLVRSFC